MFEGNVAEVKTLLPMLERCVKRHSNKRIIVVADRGLLHLDNVAEVERQQITEKRTLEYILAVPAGRYRDFATVIDGLSFAEAKDSIARVTWGGRRGRMSMACASVCCLSWGSVATRRPAPCDA